MTSRRRPDSSGSEDEDEHEPLAKPANPDLIRGAAELLQDLSTPNAGSTPVPVGHWRNDIWDICEHGPWHGSCWTACCCVPIASAQLISRMRLTSMGHPHAESQLTSSIFKTIVMAVLSFWCTRVLLFLIIAILDPNTDDDLIEWVRPPKAYYFFCIVDDVLAYVYMAMCVLQLRNIRKYVRSAYAIPPRYCGAEDTCCALACPCFVAAQLLRHTADYETTPSRCCCSETGLPVNAPSIV